MTSSTSLVILAAGLGRRFGGTKQLESVGPGGEAFLDLSITDAAAAGLERVVMVVRTDLETMVRDHLDRHPPALPVTLTFQDRLGPPRAKPWGTVHAVLSAGEAVDGPFVVVNADDHYGAESLRLAADALDRVGPHDAALVAFRLGNTVPAEGTVSRGVCRVEGGRLVGIREHTTIGWTGATLVSEHGPLDDATPVSMNLWCFDASILDGLRARWARFLSTVGDDESAECLLPDEVGELMAEGLRVEVLESPEEWIGVTNPEDLDRARRSLAARRA